jgi:hypothetical protein
LLLFLLSKPEGACFLAPSRPELTATIFSLHFLGQLSAARAFLAQRRVRFSKRMSTAQT